MSTYQQRSRYSVASVAPTEGSYVTSGGLVAAIAVPLIGLWLFVSAPLVLPSISAVTLVSAAAIALAAWFMSADRDSPGISLWDISGACAFIGFACGMVSDPQQVVEFWFAPAEPAR